MGRNIVNIRGYYYMEYNGINVWLVVDLPL